MKILCRLAALMFFAIGSAAGLDSDPATLLQAGKAEEALRTLNATIEHSPYNARAYNLLCRVYIQLELWDNAIRTGERSIALDPQNSSYHLWLGRAMGRKAEEANPFTAFSLARKVRSEFERAVALDSDNLQARSDLSEFYLEAPGFLGGDKNKARQQAEYVAKHDRALASYMNARVEEKQGNTGAEAEYKKAIAANTSPGRYWVELAHFYRRTGRPSEMEAAVTQSVSAAQPGEVVEFDAAALLLNAGRNFAGATQILRRYISQPEASEDGPVFKAHYLLGILLEKQGQKKEAAAEFKAANTMAPQYKPARDALVRISR